MNKERTARERLDSLLAGLEDEVLQRDDTSATDITVVRSLVESAIETCMGARTGHNEPPGRAEAKGMVARTVERLGRWAGTGEGLVRSAAPRVRMAFSGESGTVEREQRRGKRASRGPKGTDDEER